jgi:hypothetical protein
MCAKRLRQGELTSLTTKRSFVSGNMKAKDSLASLLLAAGVTTLTCERDQIKMEPKLLELKHLMPRRASITTKNEKYEIWPEHEQRNQGSKKNIIRLFWCTHQFSNTKFINQYKVKRAMTPISNLITSPQSIILQRNRLCSVD